MNDKEIEEYLIELAARQRPKEQRRGQFAYNLLHEMHREVAVQLVEEATSGNPGIDPFYNDDRLPAFEQWLFENRSHDF